ncbi:hypothetical protein C0995_015215, partial [Termitomyces sp. Mi166
MPVAAATAAQTLYHHHHTHSHSHSELGGGLAPPPPAPHGPRLPAQVVNAYGSTYSRTPSPPTPVQDGYEVLQNGVAGMRLRKESVPSLARSSVYRREEDEEDEVPVKPSAKALGKQRVVEEDDTPN